MIEIYHQSHAFGKVLCEGENIFSLAELPRHYEGFHLNALDHSFSGRRPQ